MKLLQLPRENKKKSKYGVKERLGYLYFTIYFLSISGETACSQNNVSCFIGFVVLDFCTSGRGK